MEDVIKCLQLGVNSRNRDHAAIGIISEMTAKPHFSYLYGGHLENVSYIQLLFYHYWIPGSCENMTVDTKIVFLSGLLVKIFPKPQFNDCCMAILFLASKKFLKDGNLASA